MESKLLGRNGIGIDINRNALLVARSRLDFEVPAAIEGAPLPSVKTFVGDARSMGGMLDKSIDLCVVHPPYGNIISYGGGAITGDLSSMCLELFLDAIGAVAKESFRVLKPGKVCAVLIGDTRINQHYVPISVGVLSRFLGAGFALKEEIIKAQHNTMSSRVGRATDAPFFYIAHERLFVFRKPRTANEEPLRWSTCWW